MPPAEYHSPLRRVFVGVEITLYVMFERKTVAAGKTFLDEAAGFMGSKRGHVLAGRFSRAVNEFQDDAVLSRILFYPKQFSMPGRRFRCRPDFFIVAVYPFRENIPVVEVFKQKDRAAGEFLLNMLCPDPM